MTAAELVDPANLAVERATGPYRDPSQPHRRRRQPVQSRRPRTRRGHLAAHARTTAGPGTRIAAEFALRGAPGGSIPEAPEASPRQR